jgi:hypothetical protein
MRYLWIMEAGIIDSDTARSSAPVDYNKARHPLTIADAVELFAQLATPRSKRSVQRFCEQGHLDCVRIKGPRGDQFFINRESVARYAKELRQIEAISHTTRSPPRRSHRRHGHCHVAGRRIEEGEHRFGLTPR